MFDYSAMHWATFFSAAVVLNVAPGPDIAFILGQTVRGGRRRGFAAMFGVWSGALVHVAMAAAGLSAILATSAAAFSLVKWLGAAYLVWLGVQALRSRERLVAAEGARAGRGAVFRRGVLVAALNPKVAVFFLAFLPQFVVPGAGPVAAQLLLHGTLIILVASLIEPLIVIASARLLAGLKSRPGVAMWLDRALGTLLIALGVRLAFARHG